MRCDDLKHYGRRQRCRHGGPRGVGAAAGAVCLFLVALVVPAASVAAAEGDPGRPAKKAPAKPTFSPGVENRIECMSVTGTLVVYLPSDYTPDRPWPVIFCYSGAGTAPNCKPFRDVLEGKGFIIVGADYLGAVPKAKTSTAWKQFIAGEAAGVKKLLAFIRKHLNVDRKQMFIGAEGECARQASAIAESTTSLWAGIVIMQAGRLLGQNPAADPRGLRGKPIYIAADDWSGKRQPARMAADYYRRRGANVTFQLYSRRGRFLVQERKKLRDWLWALGPGRLTRARLASARAAERAGHLGKAYDAYRAVAKMDGSDSSRKAATQAAERLADSAIKALAEAKKAATDQKFGQAGRVFGRISRRYAGTEFARDAAARLKALRANPEIRRIIEKAELNANADALEARARSAEKTKDYAKALGLYRLYVRKYAKAQRYRIVKDQFDALRGNEHVIIAIRAQRAEQECQKWLDMARNYIKAGMGRQAKPYLRKILTKHVQSKQAAEARKLLGTILAEEDDE